MAKEAVSNAVKDAGVSYKDFEQAFVGYVYGNDDEKKEKISLTRIVERERESRSHWVNYNSTKKDLGRIFTLKTAVL